MAESPRTHAVPRVRTIRVVVGEDNLLLQRGIVETLEEYDDLQVVEAAGDRDTLVAAIVTHAPDVVLCDLRMPPTGVDEGIQVLRTMEANRISAGFILFSQYREAALVTEVLAKQEQGRGYLLKDRIADPDEMHGAIRAVAAGNTVVEPLLVADLMQTTGAEDPLRGLSRSEREVLTLIAEGLSNEGIAGRLNITTAAVEKRVTSLFRSLPIGDSRAVNRRVAAALFYLSNREASEAAGA